MRYKIVILTSTKEEAHAIHDLIQMSKIYDSPENIISLSPVKEVCDECAQRAIL